MPAYRKSTGTGGKVKRSFALPPTKAKPEMPKVKPPKKNEGEKGK